MESEKYLQHPKKSATSHFIVFDDDRRFKSLTLRLLPFMNCLINFQILKNIHDFADINFP